ncbi:MAG TPA: hypothetical protein VGR87_00900 [Candidatus Limnocylindria bacterium]|jgi:hypothetical protein|nr:hypothetical protein [Candidatus Limnocylindria bacterium]
MRRYLDTARRYRWVILVVLALTWIPGAAIAYVEYTTSYEADATIWTQRTSQQFASISPQDPGLTTFSTPASEQAGVLKQLLATRSFLREVVRRTSLQVPDSATDERRFFEEFGKRFRIDVLGTNLFRVAYRARDPRTGPEVVLATLAQRQEHLTASRTAATEAAASFYRSELGLAQSQALDAQRELDRFDEGHKPPLLPPDEYQQRQLRLAVEDTKSRVTDVKTRIDRSGVMPGILQMADALDFQVVDRPLEDVKPSGGTRPAAVIVGSAVLSGLFLAIALIVGGTLLAGRVGAEADIGQRVPATLFATIPEVAHRKSWQTRELRTALAAVAFAPVHANHARTDR